MWGKGRKSDHFKLGKWNKEHVNSVVISVGLRKKLNINLIFMFFLVPLLGFGGCNKRLSPTLSPA